MTSSITANDREQAEPADINPTAGNRPVADDMPTPAPSAVPADVPDEADRPRVNPVTGGAL